MFSLPSNGYTFPKHVSSRGECCVCHRGCYKKVIPFLVLGVIVGFFSRSMNDLVPDIGILKLDKANSSAETEPPLWTAYPQNSVATDLAEEVRVLCIVITMPKNHKTKAKAVKKTWGRRCTVLLFISSKKDPSLPAVALPVKENRGQLWTKTRTAFQYVLKYGYLDNVDWVLKADDDTFVVMENLRSFLRDLDPRRALYLGLHLRTEAGVRYMSGGAGYVLSNTAARLLVQQTLSEPGNNCSVAAAEFEDVQMGSCMTAVGADFVDTRDEEGKNRFYPYCPYKHMGNGAPEEWQVKLLVHQISQGMDCCSRSAISFHYVPSDSMYNFYYFIYNFQNVGLSTSKHNTANKSSLGKSTSGETYTGSSTSYLASNYSRLYNTMKNNDLS